MTFDRIKSDPKKMNGQPCIRDLRLTVRRLLEALATYSNRDELRRDYPEIEEDDIRQALEYAAASEEDLVAGAALSVDERRIRVKRLPLIG